MITEIDETTVRLYEEERISMMFKDDPLFQQLSRMNKTAKLFDGTIGVPILDIDFHKDYSTKEAAEILGKNVREYNLTNLLAKEHLGDYFQVSQIGAANRFRYDWKAIFRFKLFFLLSKEAKLKPQDILEIIRTAGFLKINDTEDEALTLVKEDVEKLQKEVQQFANELKQCQEVMIEEKTRAEAVQQALMRNAARRETYLVKKNETLWKSHYLQQIEFLQEINELIKTANLSQKKEKGIFNRREKPESYALIFEELQNLIEEEQARLETKEQSFSKG